MSSLSTLIESSDLDGLVRHVDRLVDAADWAGIVDVAARCGEAVRRGKQLWAVAQFAEYRLALDAPPEYAGPVIGDGKGRYGLGPLWEVAASTHAWSELESHLLIPTTRALVAHERSIRGEGVDGGAIDEHIVGIPPELQPWEPPYPVAIYRGDEADFPEMERSPLMWTGLPQPGEPMTDEGPGEALLDLIRPWLDESDGRGQVVQVSGSALSAIRALGPHRARVGEVPFAEALQVMVWCGASGGAYGRRRGTPIGRRGAWWVLAAVLGYEDVPEPEALAEAAELRWVLWDPGDRVGGWGFHLAVEDPEDGIAWAISAADMR